MLVSYTQESMNYCILLSKRLDEWNNRSLFSIAAARAAAVEGRGGRGPDEELERRPDQQMAGAIWNVLQV